MLSQDQSTPVNSSQANSPHSHISQGRRTTFQPVEF
jgi:hypothetical protein